MTIAPVLRSLAVAIALLGVVDPAIVRSRPVPAIVAVLTPSASAAPTTTLADRVARALEGRYQVTRTRSTSAAAVIAVGDRLLDKADEITTASIAVLPDQPRIRIAAIDAPPRASLSDGVSISASVVVTGGAGRTLEVTLRAGSVALDRMTRKVSSAEERLKIPLTFVPTSEGVAALRVIARFDAPASAIDDAAADVALTIDRRVWPVLVFARRPSWMSTFVGRVLEDDQRFAVVTRTITSTAAASMTPESPATLSDPATLSRFSAIVVGAPETLTASDVAGLETYLRRRGGAVVALYDSAPGQPPAAIDQLLHVRAWRSETAAAPAVLAAGGSTALEATETAWPAEAPESAENLAEAASRSIVWQRPVGAGRVVVSGALDSWRYRESAASDFRGFWRRTIADAANASPNPIDVTIDREIISTRDEAHASVTLRNLALSPDAAGQSASVAATVDGPAGTSMVRLWPDAEPGRFDVRMPASPVPGVYRLTVTSAADTATAAWMVAASAIAPEPDERVLVEQWAHSRGGTAIGAHELGRLDDAIDRVLSRPRQPTRWHPMREPWWIAPFALLLGCEWWLRRRR